MNEGDELWLYLQLRTKSIFYVFLQLYNLYICQIIFPSFTDLCVDKINSKQKQKQNKKINKAYHASLINLGSFNWSAWSKPRQSDRSCICVL